MEQKEISQYIWKAPMEFPESYGNLGGYIFPFRSVREILWEQKREKQESCFFLLSLGLNETPLDPTLLQVTTATLRKSTTKQWLESGTKADRFWRRACREGEQQEWKNTASWLLAWGHAAKPKRWQTLSHPHPAIFCVKKQKILLRTIATKVREFQKEESYKRKFLKSMNKLSPNLFNYWPARGQDKLHSAQLRMKEWGC